MEMDHRITAYEGVDSSGSRYDLVNMLTNLVSYKAVTNMIV